MTSRARPSRNSRSINAADRKALCRHRQGQRAGAAADRYRRFLADANAGKPEAKTSDKYFGAFHPSKFFLPGPAGYTRRRSRSTTAMAASRFTTRRSRSRSRSPAPAFTYDLDGPDHQEVFPPKDKELEADSSPASSAFCARRMCATRSNASACPMCCRSSATTAAFRPNSCRAGKPIRSRSSFSASSHTAGGTPTKNRRAASRPDASLTAKVADFTYYAPGRSHPQYRLEENAGPRRLSRLCRDALSDRQRAGLCEVAKLHAVGRLLSQRPHTAGSAARTRTTAARSTAFRWCSMKRRR